MSRRDFVGAGAASITLLATTPATAARTAKAGGAAWQDNVRRVGQLNFNEIDPIDIDVEAWMDRWAGMKVDTAVIGFGGAMATYPTQVPFHRRSQYLGNRDLTGEAVAAARKRGMRVVARVDPNYAYQDAFEAHPEWFMRRKDGSPRTMMEAAYLFKTCQFGPYFTEQVPRLLREMSARYAPDAAFSNGWPGTAALEMCYCDNCRALYRDKTGGVPPETTDARSPQYRKFHRAYMDRIVEIWRLWDGVMKERNKDAFFFGNGGGQGLQMIKDMSVIGGVSPFYSGDHQGRDGERPLWEGAAHGRLARSVMDGKPAGQLVGGYSFNSPRMRHAANPPVEMESWLSQTTASGLIPWAHWLGGATRDKRWIDTTQRFFTWMAANDPHFRFKRSLANVAVLYPQTTISFYHAAGKPERTMNGTAIRPEDYLQGMYKALLEQRIPFDLIHQEKMSAAALRPYKALLIPNAAFLSDAECATIRAYVASGGSLLATFETSRYNEWGDQRSDFALQDLFGVSYAGDYPGGVEGPTGNAYSEIRQRHPALAGFEQTEILPASEFRVTVGGIRPEPAALTNIPHYPNAMPEFIYPRVARTEEPAAMFRQLGAARIAYFAGDVDRMVWTNGHPDFARLIGNAARWLVGETPLAATVSGGPGLVEAFPWESEGGVALHLVNYTTPDARRPYVTELSPVGPLAIGLTLPAGFAPRRVRALKAAADLPFTVAGGRLSCTLERLETYEVVAVEA